jgi:hypothetical protein
MLFEQVVGTHCLGEIWVSRSASWAAAVGTRWGRSGALERSRLRVGQSAVPTGLVALTCTSIELCIVVNHEHHLPLKDIAVDQAAAYAGYALVILHLLELARQQPCRSRGRRHSVLRYVESMPALALFEWRSRMGVASEMWEQKCRNHRRRAVL